MEEKKKSFPFTIVRHIVQVIVLAVFLAPVFLAGWNLFGGTVGGDNAMGTPADVFFYGSLSSSSIFGINLLDPFAFLQYVLASKSLALNAPWSCVLRLDVPGQLASRDNRLDSLEAEDQG